MTVQGIPYLVTVDRLTGWPDVRRARGNDSGGLGLVKMLRDIFTTFEDLLYNQQINYIPTQERILQANPLAVII